MNNLFEILSRAQNGETVEVTTQEATLLLLENPKHIGTFILSGEKEERVSWIGGGGLQSVTFRCELGKNSFIFWSSDHRQAELKDLSNLTLGWSRPWLPPTAREMAGCM